jgi:uncharacterized protein YcbK (DUF882 family)
VPCNEEQAFICERDINQQSKPVTVRCGNAQPTTISSTTTVARPTTTTAIAFIQQKKFSVKNDEQNFFIQQSSSSINKLQKTTRENRIRAIDPSMNNQSLH